ncbi:hypothetical protein BH11PSE10_BH11PSE10_06130 [soil metagenome]
MREKPILFGPTRSLVGILNAPEKPSTALGGEFAVIFINAGLTHHIGPNRLHVQLARALEAVGIASLRFDLSGLGDSPYRRDQLPIYALVRREPCEAMDELTRRGFRRFVLIGMCSGAYSAFHVGCDDERVAAAVMINPEDLSIGESGEAGDQSAAWARRYWSNSLLRPRAWLNLLSGRVNYRRLIETLTRQLKSTGRSGANHARSQLKAGILQAVQARPLTLFFVNSQNDVSVEYIDLVLDAETVSLAPQGALQRQVIGDCDHLFTRLEDQQRLRDLLIPWLAALARETPRTPHKT